MLAEAGVPPDVIRRLLGHTTARLVEQVYARPRASILGQQAEEKLATVASLEFAHKCDKNATVTKAKSRIEEPPNRLELLTYGLRNHCSTN